MEAYIMKHFFDSDYAANKNAHGIVYRFANETLVVTLEDYLRENPGKTEADFAALKALSDADYHETDRREYRQTWKNVPIAGMEDTSNIAVPSPENEVISLPELIAELKQKYALAENALSVLTDVQRRRYLMYHVQGMTEREIATKEGAFRNAIHQSLASAEKKI